MKIAYKSDKGLARDQDEDSIAVVQASSCYDSQKREKTLFVLADGVGGSPSGEMASYLATKYLSTYLLPEMLTTQEVDYTDSLHAGFRHTNNEIRQYAARNPQHAGMSTTLVAAVLSDDVLYVANVGDSRLYLVSCSGMRKLTSDHVDSAGGLTRTIGTCPEVEADLSRAKLKKGDIILLCCDGLTGQVAEETIKEKILASEDLDKACESLVKLAAEAGGKDNISLILAGGAL